MDSPFQLGSQWPECVSLDTLKNSQKAKAKGAAVTIISGTGAPYSPPYPYTGPHQIFLENDHNFVRYFIQIRSEKQQTFQKNNHKW